MVLRLLVILFFTHASYAQLSCEQLAVRLKTFDIDYKLGHENLFERIDTIVFEDVDTSYGYNFIKFDCIENGFDVLSVDTIYVEGEIIRIQSAMEFYKGKFEIDPVNKLIQFKFQRSITWYKYRYSEEYSKGRRKKLNRLVLIKENQFLEERGPSSYLKYDSISYLNPLDTLDFDQVMAYTVNYDSVTGMGTSEQIERRIDEYLFFGKYIAAKVEVPDRTQQKILSLFSDTNNFGAQPGDCFEPRIAIQFLKDGKDVFRILICQDCNRFVSTIELPAAHRKYYELGYEWAGRKGTTRRYYNGFSLEGKKAIYELCKQLGLAYCMDNSNH